MIRSPRRSAATVGALMVGLMFVYSTAAYIQSYKRMITRWSDQMLNADLFVSTSTLMRSTSYHFSEDLGRRIAALPEVEQIENIRFVDVPYRGDSVAVSGADMSTMVTRSSSAIIGGNKKTLDDLLPRGQGVLVSRNFATRWGSKIGTSVHLDTPAGPLDLPILGTIEDYRSEKGTIFMDRSVYKRYWNDNSVDFIDVILKPNQNAYEVKRKIQQLTSGQEHAIVYTNVEFRGWIMSLVDKFFLLNYMQLIVAVLVAVVGIANTLIISVAEREREFGIIRAIGGYQGQIRKMVLFEAFAISVVGVIVGVIGALFNIQFMSHTVSTTLAGFDVPFYFPWRLMLETFPAVVAVSLIAGWIPASHAMRTPVIEAIGYE